MSSVRLSEEDAAIVAKHRRERQEAQDTEYVQPCSKHPTWRIDVSRGQPSPVWPSCPLCAQEAVAERDNAQRPARKLDPSTAGQRFDQRYLDWLERQAANGIQPGSADEDAALARQAEARSEEHEREQRRAGKPRGAHLVSGRIENGEWIEWWAVPRRGLVRVAP